VAAITGAAAVCLNNTIQLNNTTSGGTWASGTPAIATINATSGLLTGIAAGTAGITYSITNANGCTNAVSTSRSINALPAVPAITGIASFCTGSSTVLNSPLAGSYLWSNGATTRSVAVNQPGNYTVTVFDLNNCQASSSPVNITAVPLPAASVSADIAVCQNAAAPSLVFTGSNGTAPYVFGYTINNGPLQTSNQYGRKCHGESAYRHPGQFCLPACFSERIRYCGLQRCCCRYAAIVTVNAVPAGTIQSAAGFICAGIPRQLTAGGGNTYQWYLDQQVITGATSASYSATQPGNYMRTTDLAAGLCKQCGKQHRSCIVFKTQSCICA
jgi:hypothetical protein